MSLLGRLLTPLDIFENDPSISSVTYMLSIIVLFLTIIIATVALETEPWAIRLFVLSLIYYMWFNYNNHHKLYKDT